MIVNRCMKTALCAILIVSAVWTAVAHADQPGTGPCVSTIEYYHPVTVSFFPPISTNRCMGNRVQTNFALNILGGHVGAVAGFELGTLFNVDALDMTGVQVVGGVNRVGGDFQGLELGLVANVVLGEMNGVQLGAGNYTGGNVGIAQLGAVNLAGRQATVQFGAGNYAVGRIGVQAGGINLTGGRREDYGNEMWFDVDPDWSLVQFGGTNLAGSNVFVQVGGTNLCGGNCPIGLGGLNVVRGSTFIQAGGLNVIGNADAGEEFEFSDDYLPLSSGFQYGGANAAAGSIGGQFGGFNLARNVRWFQIGGFNFARENNIAVGPMNVILNGQFRVDAFASEAATAGVEFKTGSKYFYNILGLGYKSGDSARMLLGYGIGSHIICPCPRLFVDADLAAYRVNPGDASLDFSGLNYLCRLRAMAGWQIAPPLSITGGLSLNAWLSDKESGESVPMVPVPMLKSGGATKFALWPGISLGIELQVIDAAVTPAPED